MVYFLYLAWILPALDQWSADAVTRLLEKFCFLVTAGNQLRWSKVVTDSNR